MESDIASRGVNPPPPVELQEYNEVKYEHYETLQSINNEVNYWYRSIIK